MNRGIDQNDVKQLKLEQNILRISDVYIDPDRVQVWHIKLFFFKL